MSLNINFIIISLSVVPSWLESFFFFFLDMSTQEGGRRIQTSDLRFIRRGPQLIELLIEEY
jgi:hypothetical protein